jgi:hypothetical protein
MTFNSSKCQVLHLGRGNSQNSHTISAVTIEATDTVKDLGVTLSMEANTCVKVAKANQLLGMIQKSFHHLTKDMLKNHDQTASRVLQHCYPSNDRTQHDPNRGCTMPGNQNVSSSQRSTIYEERLRRLKLPSMKYRFLRVDLKHLIALYKYTFKEAEPTARSIGTSDMKSASNTRGHPQAKSRCSMKQRSFPHRSVNG